MTRTLPLREPDISAWRKLIVAARAAAERKPYSVDAFQRAGERAFKARLPDPNDVEGRAPFLHLIGFARTWARLDAAGRLDNAEPVQAAARRCALILGLEQASPADGAPPVAPTAPAEAARRLPYHDDTFEEDRA